MCIKPVMKDLYVPSFHLGHLNINTVEKETYLGYIIDADMSDVDHIIKEIRNIYARGNMPIHNFKHCTMNVKITIFKTYIVQVNVVARCGLNFVKVQLVK